MKKTTSKIGIIGAGATHKSVAETLHEDCGCGHDHAKFTGRRVSAPSSSAFDPLLMMAVAMGSGADTLIEEQERNGQVQLANSAQLPRIIRGGGGVSDVQAKQKLEDMGVKFLRESPRDNLFYDVELPKGWAVKPTDHSMWNKLVDDKGTEIASIFFKAAFYDRDAFLNLN